MQFRPTRRTQILMAGVIIAGLVGAFVMWRNSEDVRQRRAAQQARVEATTTAEPPAAVPEQLARATVQLGRRFGGPDSFRIVYNVIEGQAVCGYVNGNGARGPGGVQRVSAFVSLPTALSLSGETEGFDDLLLRSCPNMPGARRPTAPTSGS